jgi:hypothetical protein
MQMPRRLGLLAGWRCVQPRCMPVIKNILKTLCCVLLSNSAVPHLFGEYMHDISNEPPVNQQNHFNADIITELSHIQAN